MVKWLVKICYSFTFIHVVFNVVTWLTDKIHKHLFILSMKIFERFFKNGLFLLETNRFHFFWINWVEISWTLRNLFLRLKFFVVLFLRLYCFRWYLFRGRNKFFLVYFSIRFFKLRLFISIVVFSGLFLILLLSFLGCEHGTVIFLEVGFINFRFVFK